MEGDGHDRDARLHQPAGLEQRPPRVRDLVEVHHAALLVHHLVRLLAVAGADLVGLLVEVEGVADLAGRDHLQGAGLKPVEAIEGALAVEVAADGVERVEQILAVLQALAS